LFTDCCCTGDSRIRLLNRQSPVPLYSQLYTRLAEQISSGQLKAGGRLPPKRELAESMNVSRITTRQAIDALAEKGQVYREHGRGAFVAEPKDRWGYPSQALALMEQLKPRWDPAGILIPGGFMV